MRTSLGYLSHVLPLAFLMAFASQGCAPGDDGNEGTAGSGGSSITGGTGGSSGASEGGKGGSTEGGNEQGGGGNTTAGAGQGGAGEGGEAQGGEGGEAQGGEGGEAQGGEGGEAQGGEAQGGDNQGGDNQGGDNQGGDNQGGEAGQAQGGAGGDAQGGAGQGGAGGSAQQQDASLQFFGFNNVEIPKGGEYKQMTLDGVPPFSDGVASISVKNVGSAAVTIQSVEIIKGPGVLDEEFRQSKPGSTSYKAFDFAGTKLEPGKADTLGLFFWPFASGPRTAEIVIKTSDGKSASFTIVARGRDNLVLSPTITMKQEQVYSVAPGKVSFFDPGGGTSDGGDGIVFSGAARELYDKFTRDLAMIRVKGDGTLAWAKTWSESFQQKAPEPNNETGGVADQIANGGDGYIYMGASRSTDNSNAEAGSFQALVYKVKAEDGSIAWAKGLRNGTEDQGWRGFMGYALDASLPDRVIVGGYSNSGQWAIAALSKADGSIIFSRLVDLPLSGAAGKIYSMRFAADGTGYLGGEGSSKAIIARLSGVNTPNPKVEWAQFTGGGLGTRIDSIDMTEDGAALVAYHIGGATRTFAAGRYNKDGSLAWAKKWDAQSSLATAWVVRRRGNSVFVGGKFSNNTMDTTAGDALLLVLDVATGAYKTGGAFYGGKTTTTTAGHFPKAFVFHNDDVKVMMDGYPGINNSAHYWGFWYQPPTEKKDLPLDGKDGSERVIDFAPGTINKLTGTTLKRFYKSVSTEGDPGYEVTAYNIDTKDIWKDIKTEDAGLYPARTYEHGPVGFFHLSTLTVKE